MNDIIVRLRDVESVATTVAEVDQLRHEAAVEITQLRKDQRRLDYLELEQEHELEPGAPHSLFRRNVPITRTTIDETMGEATKVRIPRAPIEGGPFDLSTRAPTVAKTRAELELEYPLPKGDKK